MSLLFTLSSLLSLSLAAPPPPVVVVFEPSGLWHGNDGPWSTFTFRIGSPSQSVFLLPVPYRNALAVVNPEGCPANPLLGPNCGSDRGNIFTSPQSETWAGVDGTTWESSETNFTVPIVEERPNKTWRNSSEQPYKPLIEDTGPNYYGVDVIKNPAKTRPWTVKSQGIVGVSSMNPFVGTFGLNTNFNGAAMNPASFFDNVRDVSGIKSVSWSYTAGSVAQNVPASLIFGGYDASRFDSSTAVSSSMHSDSRSFTIWLGDITVNDPAKPAQTSYQPKLIVDLDFTSPYISLPNQVCRNMERILGLDWDNEKRLYLVNDTMHDGLVSRNTNISFWIHGDTGKHQFVLSYKSLVLTAKPPLVNQTTRFFAVQRSRAANYVLGRAFLQEAYLTAVFDHPGGAYFNLSEARYAAQTPPKIVAIKPADMSNATAAVLATGTKPKHSMVPYLVPVLAVLVVLLAYLGWAWYTKHFPFTFRRKRRVENSAAPERDPDVPMTAKSELDGNGIEAKKVAATHEVEGDPASVEMEGGPLPPVELPAWLPPEVDGRPR